MSAIFSFADFEVDPDEGTLSRRGYTVPLQDQPFRLLVLLLTRAGTAVTREEIQTHLWPGNTYVEFDQSLRVAVSKLREALRDSANQPIYIETLPRRGYRFIAPVTHLPVATHPVTHPTSSPVNVPQPAKQAEQESAEPQLNAVLRSNDTSRRSLHPAFRVGLISVAAVVSVALGIYLVRARLKPVLAPAVAAHPLERRSVAVIGLRNLTGSSEDRWLSTALAEMLSTELSASDHLRVISGEEVARAGLADAPANTPSHETLARFGNRLGADMIVFGSYTVFRESGNSTPHLRLDLRLENLSSDAPPVALVESGSANDLFTLVSASGSQLREHFGLGELPANAEAAVRATLPANPVAAQSYAQGLERLRDFDPLGARELFERAMRIEPGHAGTHIALADTWHAMGYDKQAQAEAAKAVELGAGLPRQELLNMQADLALFSNDWPHAIELFRSLVTFYPDNVAYGLRLEQTQINASKFDEALATLANLRRLGLSRADEARIDLAEAHADLQTGDFRQTVAVANRAIQIGSELGSIFVRAQGLWIKASGLERLGDSQGSLAASAESQSLYRALGDKRGLGLALMMSGDVLYDKAQTAEARKNFLETLELFRQIGHRRNMGIVEERIGNTYLDEGALTESRKYYQLALESYRDLHWDDGVASVIGNIASVQDTEGNIPGALESNRQGLDLFEKSGDKRGIASTLSNMGSLELEQGTYERASSDFSRAYDIDKQIAYNRGLAYACIGQGDVLTARNDLTGAIGQYQQALKAIDGMAEPAVLAQAQISLGMAMLASGNGPQAASYLQQAVGIAIKDHNHSVAGYALAWLSRALLAQGKAADALVAANRAVGEANRQFGPQIRLISALALARVEIAQGKPAPAKEQIASALQSAHKDGYAVLEMESRILLARIEASPIERRHKLQDLAREAMRKGWKRLAADANNAAV